MSAYLKHFFSAEKKYGSKDRKQITSLCYNYYRLGKTLQDISVEDRIILSTFLCENTSNEFIKFHKPAWNEKITVSTQEKLLIINLDYRQGGYQLLIKDIFPWGDELGDGVEHEPFAESFLHQPDLFLRIRPGKEVSVKNKLNEAGIVFKILDEDCIALSNATKLDAVLESDKEVVVQDYNSQQVLNFLRHHVQQPSPKEEQNPLGRLSCWDCCAASGGKSILVYDILEGRVELTVSDIREPMLANLKKRFSSAGIKNHHSFIADLSIPGSELPTKNYQLIISDAPCTGSGTWSRTPERLFYFEPGMINAFAERQKKIVSNALAHLQPGGLFFYITCSVFKKENEEIVRFIKEQFHLQLLQVELLRGYDKRADNMFTAVFIKQDDGRSQ